jgi:hypothetical protein
MRTNANFDKYISDDVLIEFLIGTGMMCDMCMFWLLCQSVIS